MVDRFELLPLVVVAAGIGFWGWMFRELWMNPDLPVSTDAGLSWPPVSKNAWTVVFVALNIAGAAFYYLSVYRNRR